METCDVENDQQYCPELHLSGMQVDQIEARSARLSAEIVEMPATVVDQHGFCWSSQTSPTVGIASCRFRGPILTTGAFDVVATELTAGTQYFVRAFVRHRGEFVYSDEVSFETDAPAVVGVNATRAESPHYVDVSWEPQVDALGYRVYRDDESLGFVPAGQNEFRDSFDALLRVSSPQNIAASQGSSAEFVEVSWEAAVVDSAPHYTYSVVAAYRNRDSAPSVGVEGYAASSVITGYQMQFDEAEPWLDVGNELTYFDADAPAPSIELGLIQASQGTYRDRVALSAPGVLVADGAPRAYRVRAVSDVGKSLPSDPGYGWRANPTYTLQWQRSAGPTPEDFADLTDATSALFDDFEAPEDGEERFYRILVGAESLEAVSNPVKGYRESVLPRHLFVGTWGGAIRRIDTSDNSYHPNIPWVTSGFSLFDITVAPNGHVYVGANSRVTKYHPWGGSTYWSAQDHSGTVHGIAVDAQGDIYSAGADTTVRKRNHLGDVVWIFDGHDAPVRGVAVDTQGFVYSASEDGTVRKLDSNGTEIWSFDGHDDEVHRVAVDADGFIYTAGYSQENGNNDNSVRKLDANGSEIWSFTGHTAGLTGIALDADGNVFTSSEDTTVRKIDNNGVEVWSFEGHEHPVTDVVVDPEGVIYSLSGGRYLRYINYAGVETWFHVLPWWSNILLAVEPGLVGAFPDHW